MSLGDIQKINSGWTEIIQQAMDADKKLLESPEKPMSFDEILAVVGVNGPFQKKYNIVYNFIFSILAALPFMNLVMALSAPEHWCYVPGREFTNFSVEEWRELTVPTLVVLFLYYLMH